MRISEINKANAVLATFQSWAKKDFEIKFRKTFNTLIEESNIIRQTIQSKSPQTQYYARVNFASIVNIFEKQVNDFEKYDAWRPDKSLERDFIRNREYLEKLKWLLSKI